MLQYILNNSSNYTFCCFRFTFVELWTHEWWFYVELCWIKRMPEMSRESYHKHTWIYMHIYMYYIDDLLWRHNANAFMTSQYKTYVWIQCKLSWMREYAGKWFLTCLELIDTSLAKRRQHATLHFWRDNYLGIRISSIPSTEPTCQYPSVSSGESSVWRLNSKVWWSTKYPSGKDKI